MWEQSAALLAVGVLLAGCAVILAPFAPHLCEELWHRLGHEETLTYEGWPPYDERALAVDTITIAVQVSGKTRGTIEVPVGVSEKAAIAAAVERPIHPNDLHATILHAFGINQYRLVYRHHNRNELLTVNGGEVIGEVFS